MDPRHLATKIQALFQREPTLAPPQDKEMNAEIAELVGMEEYQTSSINATELYRARIEMYKHQVAAQIYAAKMHQQQLYQTMTHTQATQPRYERHAIIEIKNEDGSNMLLDFDVQVHMEDGEFHSLIIAAADESVTILKDEFLRRLNEDDMLCKLIYKRIVKLKLLDQAPPPTAFPGSIVKQNGQVFMVAKDGTLEPVNV